LKEGIAGPSLESAKKKEATAAKAAIFGERKGQRTRNQSKAWRTNQSAGVLGAAAHAGGQEIIKGRRIKTRPLKDRIIPPHPRSSAAPRCKNEQRSLPPTPNRLAAPQIGNGTRLNKTEFFFSGGFLLLPHISNLRSAPLPISPCPFPPAPLDPLLRQWEKKCLGQSKTNDAYTLTPAC